jgi:hypothetical protein
MKPNLYHATFSEAPSILFHASDEDLRRTWGFCHRCTRSISVKLGRHRRALVLPVLLGISLLTAGCGGAKRPSENEQLKELGVEKQPTAKFAGTVTIDGKPPKDVLKQGIWVMLYDPDAKPPKTVLTKAGVNQSDGHFSFSTYEPNDGVLLGSYTVLFVALEHAPFRGSRGYHGPDGLKNLFNDPDKNKQNPEFHVTVEAPGKTDYQFNLEMAGKEPPPSPGPKAITKF